MAASLFEKLAANLRARRADLSAWLKSASRSEKEIRLGPHTQEEAERQLQSVESAIQKAEREELGLCDVCHETVETHLLEMDYEACVCLTHLNDQERSRLESELELSQKVQRALLPRETPSIPGWEVTAFSQPASIVGGDYFDFLKFADGAHGLLIADVMGKGMPASMLMANLQASLRILVPESTSPSEVLNRLNKIFHHNISLTKFVSLFLARLETDAGRLTYVNAGHNPPLIVRGKKDGSFDFSALPPNGAAIGLVEESNFEAVQVEIQKGDLLVMYTDGVVEGRNPGGLEYGEERLRAFLSTHLNAPLQEQLKGLRTELQGFAKNAPPTDDTTVILGRRVS